MNNLDLLVESAAIQGQLSAGVSPKLVAARSSLGSRGVAVFMGRNSRCKPTRSPAWSREENEFLKSSLGNLSDEEMAAALGRSTIAVHLRWKRDMGLPAPSKNPEVMTAEQIANGLGADSKTIHRLIDRGILRGRRLPFERVTRVVNRVTLLRFIVNPMNWIYFSPARVGGTPRRCALSYDKEFWSYARRLVRKKQKLWKDEWWRIGKVAEYHGVNHRLINKAIHEGRLKAMDWGNWWVLKSHATDPLLRFYSGKGRKGEDKLNLSSQAEAFLILALAVGLTYSDIGALMNWKEKRVMYVLCRLRIQRRIPCVIKENKLKVLYNKKTGEGYANWRAYRKTFPHLSGFMDSLKSNPSQTRSEKKRAVRVKNKARGYLKSF